MKRGGLKPGRSGKKVTSRKQAIAKLSVGLLQGRRPPDRPEGRRQRRRRDGAPGRWPQGVPPAARLTDAGVCRLRRLRSGDLASQLALV
ncbi:MAG: DUF6496 domain-containing protein [Vulcanimicrobiaceae bacterium]